MLVALIVDNIVVNVKDMTDEEIHVIGNQYSSIIDCTNIDPTPNIGDIFDGVHIIGTSPSVKITKLAFMNRFTDTELATLEGFANQANSYAYALRSALRKHSISTYIDLLRPDTIAGINNMVALGLITSARADVILNPVATEIELYKG